MRTVLIGYTSERFIAKNNKALPADRPRSSYQTLSGGTAEPLVLSRSQASKRHTQGERLEAAVNHMNISWPHSRMSTCTHARLGKTNAWAYKSEDFGVSIPNASHDKITLYAWVARIRLPIGQLTANERAGNCPITDKPIRTGLTCCTEAIPIANSLLLSTENSLSLCKEIFITL